MPTSEKSTVSYGAMARYSAASFGLNIVNALSTFALPLYLAGYGLPAWLIGVLSQERSSLGGIEQPVIGLISDRTRTRLGKRRPFFIIGVLMVTVSLYFLSTHPPLWAVVLNLTLFASFLAVAGDPYQALMADLFPSEQRGRVGAALGLANMAGQVTFLLLAIRFWEENEPWTFYVTGFGLIASFAITFFGIREPKTISAPPPSPWRGFGRYWGELLSHREFAKYGLSQLLFWLGVGGIVPFLTRFAVVVLGVSESDAFGLSMVAVVSTFLFTAPAGILGDRLGKQRVLGWGLAAFALITIIGSQAQDAFQGAVMMGLVGIANAMTTTLGFPLYTEMMPRRRLGEFTGFAAMVISLSQAVGAGLVGGVVDLTGDYRVVFIVGGLLIGASCLVLRWVHPERAKLLAVEEETLDRLAVVEAAASD